MKRIILVIVALCLFKHCDALSLPNSGGKKNEVWIEKLRTLVLVIENRETISEMELIEFDTEYNQLDEEYRKIERSFTEKQFAEIRQWRQRYNYRRTKSKIAHSIRTGIYNAQQFMREVCEPVR